MRDNLSAFFKGSWDVIEPATKLSWSWHHDAICEHMQAVAEWKLHKLIIAVPPRHTKSSVVSVAFPAWLWITHPGARFLCASYGLSLSLRDSQRCRDLIDSPWYQSRWGNSFSWLEDQNAKGRYQNTSMGYRIATSVGGAATGEGADYILTDDAHNIQEGESELVREETLNWWDRVMTSRLNDQQTGCMVVVAQRVHEQDLIGHLLETGDWEYLCLPAEYESEKKTITSIGWEDPRQEDGEVLWEEKFPKVVLEQLKKTLLMHYFAQYQQRPTAAEGALLKDEWFHQYIDAGDHYVLLSEGTRKRVLKAQCRTVISTDFAVSQKQEADYTVFLTWAVTPDLKFLLTDIVRDRMEAPDSEEYLLNMAISSKRLWTVLVEDVAYQKAIIQRLRRGTPIQGTHMKRGIPVTPFRPMVDKTSRVQSLAVYFASECFFYSNQVAGYIEYKKELTSFPRTEHDDRVDATSILLALFAFAEPRISSAEDITEVEENEHIKELMKTNPELAEFLLGESDDDIQSILQSLVR